MFGSVRWAVRGLAVMTSFLAADLCRAQYPVPYYPTPPVAYPTGYYQPVMYVPAGAMARPMPMGQPMYPGLPNSLAPCPVVPFSPPMAPFSAIPEVSDLTRNAARSLQATPSGIPLETCAPPTFLPDCDGGIRGSKRPSCGRGPWSIQTLVGSQFHVGPDDYQYGSVNVRFGYLTDYVCFDNSILRGQIEPVLDVMGGLTYASDFGTWLGGPSLLMRYNFTKADKLQPYVQAGFGGVYNDAYRDNQNHLGQPVVLLGQAGIGTRYFLSPNCSFDLEGQYNHMSSFSGGSIRNLGIDAFGASGGFTYYFGSRQ
ncbi:MAG: acyloxyacyl hydrolase [Gemmataceae bacterium]